jgi:drug/metabolite transporter (DMT)-like permease
MLDASAARPAADSTRPLALGAVAGAVLTWGASNVVPKLLSSTGLVISFYRLWFAIPLLWTLPVLLPSMRRRLTPQLFKVSLVGGGLFAVHQVLFFTSLKMTSVANVAIIAALQPVLVVLVSSRMFGEDVSLAAFAWSLVAVVGAALVVLGSMGSVSAHLGGDGLALANLFAFTAYFLASKRFRRSVGATEYVLGMTTVCGVVMLAICVATRQQLLSPSGNDWWWLIVLALFPGTLGHFLTNWAHPHLPVFLVSVILLAVPVIAALGAWVILGESLGIVQVVGGSIVLMAIGILVSQRPVVASEELAESVAETDAP